MTSIDYIRYEAFYRIYAILRLCEKRKEIHIKTRTSGPSNSTIRKNFQTALLFLRQHLVFYKSYSQTIYLLLSKKIKRKRKKT